MRRPFLEVNRLLRVPIFGGHDNVNVVHQPVDDRYDFVSFRDRESASRAEVILNVND
jgi:hypothetical protein